MLRRDEQNHHHVCTRCAIEYPLPAESPEVKLGRYPHSHHLVFVNEMHCHSPESGAGCYYLDPCVGYAFDDAFQLILLTLGVALQLLSIMDQDSSLQGRLVNKLNIPARRRYAGRWSMTESEWRGSQVVKVFSRTVSLSISCFRECSYSRTCWW